MSLSEGLSSKELEGYFDQYGWSVEQLDDITFRTGFRGRNATFTALVRLTEHWVVFTINPLVRPPEDGWGRSSLLTLASANHQINLAKFGIDPDDDCFLTVELPTEGFCYDHFTEAMTALTHVADAFVLAVLQARAVDRAGAS
jgi:hypothetical protein